MCGIIAAASNRNVGKLLVQGLHKMEYRGYDSAGIALHQDDGIAHLRTLGKVQLLEEKMISEKPKSKLGIAHTRWATHGEPSETNAHPHKSQDSIYIVHNGIIENYVQLKEDLKQSGYEFSSQTDSELIAHLLDHHINQGQSMVDAMYAVKEKLEGAYAIAAIDIKDSTNLVIARNKSPLLIGIGTDEMFAASDPLAIAQQTNDFIFLEDGDVAEISANTYKIFDESKKEVVREITRIDISAEASSKGEYRHYMEKEIYEQPEAVSNTIDGRIGGEDVLDNIFGEYSPKSLIPSSIDSISLIFCFKKLIDSLWLFIFNDFLISVRCFSSILFRKFINDFLLFFEEFIASNNKSVIPESADTITINLLFSFEIISITFLTLLALATDVPPNFKTFI